MAFLEKATKQPFDAEVTDDVSKLLIGVSCYCLVVQEMTRKITYRVGSLRHTQRRGLVSLPNSSEMVSDTAHSRTKKKSIQRSQNSSYHGGGMID